eukprot:2911934-Pleurochrysis_carterae.AAC.1
MPRQHACSHLSRLNIAGCTLYACRRIHSLSPASPPSLLGSCGVHSSPSFLVTCRRRGDPLGPPHFGCCAPLHTRATARGVLLAVGTLHVSARGARDSHAHGGLVWLRLLSTATPMPLAPETTPSR